MTRGEVIKHKGKYIRAWFHSNAGGKTATAEEGLAYKKEATPYIQSVTDPGQKVADPDDKEWKASFSLDEVRSAVIQQAGKDPGQITSASIVVGLRTGCDHTLGCAEISGSALRMGLGPERMRSTLLDRLAVEEAHCRWLVAFWSRCGNESMGSYYMAKGANPYRYHHYYFKDVEIEKIWE